MLRELYNRQSHMTITSLMLLTFAGVTFGLQFIDQRFFDGVNVWIKPTKFFFAVAVLLATQAWLFGYVQPARRNSLSMRTVVWTTIIGGVAECLYIAFQAAHREASHFNQSDLTHTILYALMGVAIVLVMLTFLVLAWEIAFRPTEGLRTDYRVAVVLGLVLAFILGGGSAGYMSEYMSHSVGAVGGHFPIFGWNRHGGDLRVAHFFGLHLHQALPVTAALMAPLPTTFRWAGLIVATLFGVALTVFTFVQALNGMPFLPQIN